MKMVRKNRAKALDLRIYQRDCWLCRWCGDPVIFAPARRLQQLFLRRSGWTEPLAYYHANWRWDISPALTLKGASIDHKTAVELGGTDDEDNLVTACWECNLGKNNKQMLEWEKRHKRNPVKGKYGDPKHWRGETEWFVVLAKQFPSELSPGDREWLRLIEANLFTK